MATIYFEGVSHLLKNFNFEFQSVISMTVYHIIIIIIRTGTSPHRFPIDHQLISEAVTGVVATRKTCRVFSFARRSSPHHQTHNN